MGHTRIKHSLLPKLENSCQLNHIAKTENNVLPTGIRRSFNPIASACEQGVELRLQ